MPDAPTTPAPAAPAPAAAPSPAPAASPASAPTAPAETKPPEAPPPPKPDDSASAREVERAKLLRDRSTFQKEKSALEAEKKAVEAQKAELAALSKENPLAALQKLGKTPEEIAQLLLHGGKPPDEDPQAKTIRELRAELEAVKATTTSLKDAHAADEQRAAKEREAADRAALVSDLEEHAAEVAPSVLASGRIDDVIAEARKQHQETGEIDWVAAAKAVEPKAKAEVEAAIDRALKYPALRAIMEAKLKPATPAIPSPPAAPAPPVAATEPAPAASEQPDRFAAFRPSKRNGATIKAPQASTKHAPTRRQSFEEFIAGRQPKT